MNKLLLTYGLLGHFLERNANVDLHTMIERANAQLAKRNNALKQTLEEITLVEALDRDNPDAYTYTLTQLRTKRDRQQAAVKATEGLIKSFNAALKKPSK